MPRILPSLPEIGHPESFYAKQVHRADKCHDQHGHEAYKVGQYITLGLNPHLQWAEKLKYFRHALARHCNPPAFPDDQLWTFYANLAELVRRYCGLEALRIIVREDEIYASRAREGQSRDRIQNDAEEFFRKFVPGENCPEWFSQEDFENMKLIRNQWI